MHMNEICKANMSHGSDMLPAESIYIYALQLQVLLVADMGNALNRETLGRLKRNFVGLLNDIINYLLNISQTYG